MTFVEIVASVMLLAGVVLFVVAAIGLHRFGDVYARLHAATKPATLGLLLILAAAALRVDDPGDMAKLALIAMLQLITAPVSAHLIGRAAYRAGTPMEEYAGVDELARDLEEFSRHPDEPTPR